MAAPRFRPRNNVESRLNVATANSGTPRLGRPVSAIGLQNLSNLPNPNEVDDLCDLKEHELTEDAIVSILRTRYLASRPYTSISPSFLISINPNAPIPLNSQSSLQYHIDEVIDTGSIRRGREVWGGMGRREKEEGERPHVYGLAGNVWMDMRRTGRDQSVLLSGESGSGKSEIRRLIIKAFLALSQTAGSGYTGGAGKPSKLASKIENAQYILECFGNASTLANSNASRFGSYTELQFNDHGKICGSKTLDYYLERTRISGPAPGERNFHVFYYLVSGASTDEKDHMRLGDTAGGYRFLRQAGNGGGGGNKNGMAKEDDKMRFEQLKQALKVVGFSKRLVAQICQLIATILHLGNLEFEIDHTRNEDSAVVRNIETLEIVAEFLGVHMGDLESTLSMRTKFVGRELCTVFLDPEGAETNRDELAKSLYSLLFAFINEHINSKLCKDDFATFVGVLDLPGPQNLSGFGARANSLDQFCINYANERLQNWILQSTFERQSAEFAAEGLAGLIPKVNYFDNSECVRLLTNQPGGLIHIMDDQSKKMGKKTDHTMAEAFAKRWGSHPNFKAGASERDGYPTFTVSHYSGAVTYSAEAFLEKNANTDNPDFVSLLRGSMGRGGAGALNAALYSPGCSNSFIKELFNSRAIATQAHPRDDLTIVAAQQPVKPMRKPSTRRKVRNASAKLGTLGEDVDEEAAIGEFGVDGRDFEDEELSSEGRCVVGEFRSALDVLFQTFDETKSWHIACLNPNDSQLSNQVDSRGLKSQIRSLGLVQLAKRMKINFQVSMTYLEFVERYGEEVEGVDRSVPPFEAVRKYKAEKNFSDEQFAIGKYKLFVSPSVFRDLEDVLRHNEEEERRMLLNEDPKLKTLTPVAPEVDPFSPYRSSTYGELSPMAMDTDSKFNLSSGALPLMADAHPRGYDDEEERRTDKSDADYAPSRFTSQYDDSASYFGSEAYAPSRNMFHNMKRAEAINEKEAGLDGTPMEGEVTEKFAISQGRKNWVALCWALTWFVPPFLLKWPGGMKRPDVRQAWREKLAINVIIWFICGCAVFVVAIMGNLICPREFVYSQGEISQQSYANNPDAEYVSIRGEVFDLTGIAKTHLVVIPVVKSKAVLAYGGEDATALFPVQVSALCDGIDGSVSPWVQLNSVNSSSSLDSNSVYHDFRSFTNDSRPDWYYEQMVYMRYNFRLGFVGLLPKTIKASAAAGSAIAIYEGHVYDVTTYVTNPPYLKVPDGFQAPAGTSTTFMAPEVISLFQQSSGKDITKSLNALGNSLGQDVLARQLTCLRNLYLAGKVDNRQSVQCQFATYILLALSVVMVSIIGFKFLGALYFGAPRSPEDHEKFVICQVPCYTEGEESLRKTIDSVARLKYDDKRKLLFIICDGMIVGSGNDRPTPRIVLDILGVDPNIDPEPLSCLSLGEGQKQLNMGRVYAGLYECAGHVVPYVVLVKIGKPNERHRPGNRGKRDSQMLLLHFLNKVHFDSPMNPLELEVYHQIKNVIGVNPSFYEFLFTIDADTTCDAGSLGYLVSAMIHDKKVIACCGETSIANAKQSLTTMMQVYEYYISHHLAKSFESLFGSVTCLPGCFSLYRVRTPDTHKPLFVSNDIIHSYSENRVDTLHLKNLLHLGEDRYLTTLLLRNFPSYKTIFVREAKAQTVAPDEWKVLLSQRRRWINSTVHNLAELVFLDRLCGFCCFSMRFVVFIDLLSTIVAPVTVAYIVYLIYLVVADGKTIPTFSLVLLCAIYGLQALIFLLRGKWDMIGWMIFYILAIPIFSFYLPLYSFWAMDDFSWGSTRVVVGESGKKIVIHDEGKFDVRSIPLKSWQEYEEMLWEVGSNHSIGSWKPPVKPVEGNSIYGRATIYGGTDVYQEKGGFSRDQSPVPSGFYAAPPVGPNSDVSRGRGMHMSHGAQGNSPARYSSYSLAYDQPVQMAPYRDGPPSAYDSDGAGLTSARSSFFAGGPNQTQQYQQQDSYRDDPNDRLDHLALGPTNFELESSVRRILADADLTQVTKKAIRRQLEQEFSCDLTAKKDVINKFIEETLTQQ